ncbi:unnamed protein product [Thelazia callipaeda]|uniref:NUC173 domain-containing protein n=1 Tax=Thelazia callipaeda TaxID=103827 RepID=A0A0N5CN36_THECL|nr:unnamed protein product [Thelazia callipaeda]
MTFQKQLWDLLPNLLSSPTDFISQFPVLAKILLKVLVEERDLQLIVLSSIRSALRFALLPDAPAARKDMMSEFAYSFMRILFNLYGVADATKEDVEGITETSIGVLQCSALETIRMYVKLTPSVVIDNFINLAVKSIQLEDVALTRKIRILDLMAALVKKANTSGLNSMFSVIHPWFLTNETALQKKAFRIMEQIMKRSADKNAAEFFSLNDDEISHILDQGLDTIALNARAPLLAVYHCKLLSLTSYEGVQNFKARFLEKIIICLDKSHNIRTRSNALKCFVKLCQQLILFGSSKNETPSNALHSVLNTIFATLNRARKVCSNDDLSSLENARSANIALNIIAQKYVRVMDTPLLSDLIAHACNGIGDGRPAIRVLVIRLMRMLVKKLPNYAMQQYQELIISAVFDGQLTSDVTQKVRKANKLLLEVLIDRIGVEVLITRTNKLSWIKQLKSAAKRRRRISRRNTQAAHSTKTDEESDVPSTVPSVRTAGADTVLDMLSNSGSDGEETDEESVGCRTRGSSIWLKNDNEEDMMDLLDQNKMLKNIATAQPASLKDKRVQKLDKNCDGDCGEFKMTEDGRIIIEDTDMEENNEMIRRRLTGILHFTDKKMKVDGVDSDENEDHDLEHTSMVKSAACHNNKSTKASRCIRPKKSAISRQNRRYEPYAYIPLKQKKKQKVALKTLIKEAVADAKMRKD